jgi:hypothetical protein
MSDTAGPDEPSTDAAVPENDVKDKFRQALERKRGHHADRDAAADHLSGPKIGGEHASAKTKRTFRRKSG